MLSRYEQRLVQAGSRYGLEVALRSQTRSGFRLKKYKKGRLDVQMNVVWSTQMI
jgi:hypothetical protein